MVFEIGQRDLTERIIGAAVSVHREPGPGFLEGFYEEALAVELQKAGLSFERRKSLPGFYRGQIIGRHRLDQLVGSGVVVKLKPAAIIEDIFFAIVRPCMKAAEIADGLLLKFAAMPLTIRRVGRAAGFSPS